MSQDGLSSDPLVVDIPLHQNRLQLRLEPADGWSPNWKKPLIAVVVICSTLLSLLLAAVLISRAQHKALLKMLVPRNVIRCGGGLRLRARLS